MSTTRLYNTSARPRMLIRGFKDDERIRDCLAALVPTSMCVESLREVHQDEWDVLVTDGRVDEVRDGPFGELRLPLADHLFVVYQPPRPGSGTVEEMASGWRVLRQDRYIRRELRRPGDAPLTVQPLVEALEPVLRARDAHEHFEVHSPQVSLRGLTLPQPALPVRAGAPKPVRPKLRPFAETADGKVLAGRYNRSEHAEAWLIPSDAPDLIAWVSAALSEWHVRDRERFPGSPDWGRQRVWATSSECALLDEIDTIKTEREATLEALAAREREATARLATARDAADAYERALLTQDSEQLVDAVHRALGELGFTVTDADKDLAERERLEDLRVEDRDAPGWVALAEVKGYSKGAQTGAITQFLRFERRFRRRTGRDPDALWYIANQFKARDPAARQTILQGNEADIDSFAESSGLVIDTVELFRLLAAVRDGHVSNSDARRSLRGATGRYGR